MNKILNGDCLEVMPTLEENSVDAIITDPPYGLSFMGKAWDHGVPGVAFWKEAVRVAKPGAFLLAFGGTRTHHRLICAIEDAGFEIRDCMMWLYGSGFPKSHDVSKAIDKAAGAEREKLRSVPMPKESAIGQISKNRRCADCEKPFVSADPCRCPRDSGPATSAAKQWSGWGTALKPAWEPIIVARKPLEGTVAENILKWGCGAMNIDASRIGTERIVSQGSASLNYQKQCKAQGARPYENGFPGEKWEPKAHNGRWPANVILDEDAGEMLDGQSGDRPASFRKARTTDPEGIFSFHRKDQQPFGHHDSGGASRFFYCAKASKKERNAGCEGMPEYEKKTLNDYKSNSEGRTASKSGAPSANFHPTVKPVSLLNYLAKLVCPIGGLILDPFMGSGSTGIAAQNLGCGFIGIEREKSYCDIADARLNTLAAA